MASQFFYNKEQTKVPFLWNLSATGAFPSTMASNVKNVLVCVLLHHTRPSVGYLRISFCILIISNTFAMAQRYHSKWPTWSARDNLAPSLIEAETKWTLFHRRHFKCIFVNENVWILTKISLKFVHKGPINNFPALVQIMAWHWQGIIWTRSSFDVFFDLC